MIESNRSRHAESSHRPFTLLIVSDHGFRKTSHAIYPNALLRQEGLVRDEHGKPTWDAWVVPDGGMAMVYVTDPTQRAELLPKAQRSLRRLGGSGTRICAGGFRETGAAHAEQSNQAPDLLLAAKPGNVFASGAPTEKENQTVARTDT